MSNSMKAASMLARAASDPEFRARFKSDPEGVSAECGVTIHPHPNYEILQDEAGTRHIVVTEDKHGSISDGTLPASPSIADVRRWAIWHVHQGDATGDAIRADVNAAILAAGATAPGGLKFMVSVDDPQTMHIAIPASGGTEIALDDAEIYAGAGAESVDTNTTEAVEAETTEVTVTETTELQDTETTTTVVAEVEVAVVPGFIT